jgi:fucose permease
MRSPRSTTLAAHAAFLPIGMVTVLLGPMLPILSERWALGYGREGYLFMGQFLGATIGVSLSGRIIRYWGYRRSLMLGLGAMALGVAILPRVSLTGGLFAIACYGVAIGLMGPTCNLLMAEIHPLNRGAALNLLNFSWSVGAVGCPFLVAAAARVGQTSLLLEAIGAVAFLIMLAIPLAVPSWIARAEQRDGAQTSWWSLLWSRPGVLVLCALFFLYVGTENSIGGWLASYARSSGSAGTLTIVTSSFFYFALLVGRLVAPLILRRTAEVYLARIGLAVAVIGTLGLVGSHTMGHIVLTASVAGLGLSSVFPITIAMLPQSFGSDSPAVAPVFFNMANVGGATLPFMVGYAGERFASLSTGLMVPLAAAITMLTMFCVFIDSKPAPRVQCLR